MAKSTVALIVREAVAEDAAAIASSHVRSWQAGYEGVISSDYLRALDLDLPQRTVNWQTRIVGAEAESRLVLVGALDGEVAGWLSSGPCRDIDSGKPPPGEVYGCYVDPVHWSRGVGSALMAEALARLALAGYSEAVLWVLKDNARARAFYKRHGWSADGAGKWFELADERYSEIRYRHVLP